MLIEAYAAHVGKVEVPKLTDTVGWDGKVMFRIPSSVFSFPMPRGSGHPWSRERAVGKLEPIKCFDIPSIDRPTAQR